jgi:hypothetical protein
MHYTAALTPFKGRLPSISRLIRYTVPPPTLHSAATFKMPLPVRNWLFCGAQGRCWHKADMMTVSSAVRFSRVKLTWLATSRCRLVTPSGHRRHHFRF